MLEVEVKAKINQKQVEKKLLAIGASSTGKEEQIDTYFNHPCVDFKLRDEALRVRKVGSKTYLTFKGPKVDPETKTRNEIELEVKGEIFSLLKVLGRRKVYEGEE